MGAPSSLAAVLTCLSLHWVVASTALPPHTVYVDPRSFAVLDRDAVFRKDSFSDLFNPTNASPPFFQAFHPSFLSVLGDEPSFRVIASNPGFAFAHEAPIWDPRTEELYFCSNAGGALGFSDIDHNNQVAKISFKDVDVAVHRLIDPTANVNVTVTKLDLPDTIQMTNGGTGPFYGSLLLVNSGRGSLPPSLALVNPANPQNASVILDNFFGRQFNSPNDAKIHPKSGRIFFTDVTYGFLNHFRPPPLMPNQIYRFDPHTGEVRVVADGFNRPNGIAFSQDGRRAYIGDSGTAGGFLGNNQTDPATIYTFDVDPDTEAFINRRVFAYVDTGIPDGLQLDTKGNVYSGCGDGVQVWNSQGTLIGKFFLGTSAAQMLFVGKGRLVILVETKILLVELAAEGFSLAFP